MARSSSRRREARLKTLGLVGLGVLALATVGAVVGVSIGPEAPPTVSNPVASYYDSNKSLAATAKPSLPPLALPLPAGAPLRVLFAGDSLTVGRDASAPEKAFRSLMVDALKQKVPVVAATIGKSSRMTAEVEPMIKDDAGGHDLLVVELGTNDVYKSTPEKFAVDYPRFLDAVKAASPKAALICAGAWKVSPTQLTMDRTIQAECEKRGGRFAPLSPLYGDPTNLSKAGVPHWDGGLTDGNHPNDAGHRKIADALLALFSFS